MKKLVLALVAIALLATPALAELKFGGYYRLQGIATNSDDSSVVFDGQNSKEPNTQSLIDQRLRLKVDNSFNEYVTLTWFGEVDGTFGVAGKDGGPGGDRVSVETKNAYINFMIPDTMFTVKAGLQGIGNRYQGLIVADDWSAIKVGAKINDTTGLTLLYSKPSEGAYNVWDDVDFYNASLDTKVADVNLGFDLAWLDYNAIGAAADAGAGDSHLFDGSLTSKPFDLYYAGIKADAKFGDIGVDGFFLYAFGSEENPTGDVTPELDLGGYAATVRATTKINDLGLGARLIYMSGDADLADNDVESFAPNLGGNYDFAGENLMIMLTDAYYNNGPGGRLATEAATANGSGLMAITAQLNTNIDAYYTKLGVGYFMAADTPTGVDDGMGAEIAGRVGTKIAEKVDFSVAGAYALLGDYWAFGGPTTPDDIWKLSMMVNVGF